MDSKLIYTAMHAMEQFIEWENYEGNEWCYTGMGEDLKREFVIEKINAVFNADTIYIALGRQDSKEINKDQIEMEIIQRIGTTDFMISNPAFDTFIEFSDLGVFRVGKKIS